MLYTPTQQIWKFLLPQGEGQDEGNQIKHFVDDFDPLTPTLSRRERGSKAAIYDRGQYIIPSDIIDLRRYVNQPKASDSDET